ncbi:MAG: acyl-CoA/acyl-ACP dehydrogenase [Deltaproteobacteria bacterium]|nr:acyl-CoA/acyl-ACP dehydrogenase [Deltaproteobacteria bacterium]
MRFALDEEQVALQRAARRLLERWSPSAAVRDAMETERGYDDALWQRLAADLGVSALLVPEALGGLGLGPTALAPVMEEMGRALACAPLLSTVALGTNALLLGASAEQQARWLPGLASGERTATVAFDPLGDARRSQVRAVRDGGSWRLDGVVTQVLDGHTASLVVVAAEVAAEDALALFLVPGDAPGLARTALPTMDRTRRLARLELHGVSVPPADRLDGPLPGAAALRAVLDRARVALASEQVGLAERCLDMSVEHARTRVQFGRPIGSFQAIKHRCADMLVDVESARAASWYAAWAAEHAPDELATAAAMAKAWCSEACFRAAAECIQIHGGIGFTWEHDAHLAFKRARASLALFGAPANHRETIAHELGL